MLPEPSADASVTPRDVRRGFVRDILVVLVESAGDLYTSIHQITAVENLLQSQLTSSFLICASDLM